MQRFILPHPCRLTSTSAPQLLIPSDEAYTCDSSSSARLTTGGIAAVAIGGVFGLFLIAGIILLCCRMRGSGNGKLFGLKGKSQDRDPLVAEAFHYRPVSSYMDSSASNHTLTHEGSLHSRPSQGTLGSGRHFQQGQVQTPPSTSLWPSSGGTGSGAYGHSADQIVQGPNVRSSSSFSNLVIDSPDHPDTSHHHPIHSRWEIPSRSSGQCSTSADASTSRYKTNGV